MITIAINAAINPYSMEVTPRCFRILIPIAKVEEDRICFKITWGNQERVTFRPERLKVTRS